MTRTAIRLMWGVDNVGEINANGGHVYIQAEAAQNVFGTLVNQAGIVKAGSTEEILDHGENFKTLFCEVGRKYPLKNRDVFDSIRG